MDLSYLPFSARAYLMGLVLCIGLNFDVGAQTNSPYRRLVTSVGVTVSDTLIGQSLSLGAASPSPNHGDRNFSLTQGAINTCYVTYKPDPGFVGVDTFVVEKKHGPNYPYDVFQGYIVSVYPSLLNAKGDFALTSMGTTVNIPVLDNDSGSNPPLTLTGVPLTNHGTVSINPDGTVAFTPEPGFVGLAHFNYSVCDALGTCKTSSVDVGVSDAPSPGTDSLRVATAKNTPLTIPLNYNGYSLYQAPMDGIVTVEGGYVFRYEPQYNYTGVDKFVLVNNLGATPTYKTVTVDVLNTPTQNKMAMDDYVFTPQNLPITFNVRSNDIGNLHVTGTIVSATSLHGTLEQLTPNGTMTFTPDADFSGVATFQYSIGNQGTNNLETATVNVVVGNMPPSQGTFYLTTPKETPLVINYQIPFLGFDFSILDAPDNGNLSFYPGFSSQTINGQTVSGNNMLKYTPYSGYVGNDQFEINYCITETGQCQSVKIDVNVLDVTTTDAPYCLDDCVWAGDVNCDGIVNNKDLLPLGYFMGEDGFVRPDASLEWYGQYAGDWADPYSAFPFDLKHADTDGNGAVTVHDTAAINTFYGQTHNITPTVQPIGKGLPFFLKFLTPLPVSPGDLVMVDVSLGNSSLPVTNIYGFTYDVSLSPKIVDSAFHMQYLDYSWLNQNAPSLAISKRPRQGRLETAFTRTNGVAASGYGKIGSFSFIVIEILEGGKPDENLSFTIYMEGGQVVMADGSVLHYEGGMYEVPVSLRKQLTPNAQVQEGDLLVYPSPASEYLNVHLNGSENMIEELSIVNTMGKQVWQSGAVEWKHAELGVGTLPNGIYFAVAKTRGGRVTKKFEVIR